MTSLHEQITQKIAKRRAVALAASQTRDGSTPTGEHWHWACGQHRGWVEIPITDVVLLDEYLDCPGCDGLAGWLVSREQHPTASVGPLPHMVLSVEELTPTVALHIQMHDPATVVRHCDRDLRVLRRHTPERNPDGGTSPWCECGSYRVSDCPEIADLAAAYGIETKEDADTYGTAGVAAVAEEQHRARLKALTAIYADLVLYLNGTEITDPIGYLETLENRLAQALTGQGA